RDPGAERRDQRPDLGRREHLVEARFFDVQDLPAKRQDRLELPVAPLLGAAARAVSLDDEELREGGVFLLAVRELSGERRRVERSLAPDELPRLARGLASPRRFHDLLEDLSRDPGVLLEVR